MSAKHRCKRDGSKNWSYPVTLTPANAGRSRASLLAGASLIALAALGAPDRAFAACSGKNQTISSPSFPGPIFGKGGNITVDAGASVAGGPTGVYAKNCGIGALTNRGEINGGGGAGGFPDAGGNGVKVNSARTIDLLTNANGATISGGNGGTASLFGGPGGAGVSNAGTIATLTNRGAISGGSGGKTDGQGGAGVLNAGTIGSNGGTIRTLSNSGTISGGNGGSGSEGGAGGVGVSDAGTIRTLSNSGKITGGAGGETSGFGGFGGAGVSNPGAIMSNPGTIRTLSNRGTISGGNGGSGSKGGAGGAGVSNAHGGTIATLTNSGTISGGIGGSGFTAGKGGAGLSNAGTIMTLTNGGAIGGGNGGGSGGFGTNLGGMGGVGASNAGTIKRLTNNGTISGGNGGAASGDGGAGGVGVSNPGAVTTLSNSGVISGGSGGTADSGGGGGGAGIANSGTIKTLTNSGTIEGGVGGKGSPNGAAGDAIYSAGAGASIGLITNTGKIIGNVEIDNQASVTVTGGSGKPFGKWTGGTITIGNGDLTFVRNTALRDDISVDGGNGTVTNMGRLRVAAPETIAGDFTQAPAGVLVLNFAGDVFGEYGTLTVTKLTTLDGRLTIRLTGGFTLTTHDSFDILAFGGLTGNFDALTLDGVRCSSPRADIWTCGGGVRLKEVIDSTSLDLLVTRGSSVFGPAGSSPIPELSTWAMLALGFLGLGGLGLKGRRRAAPDC